MTSDGVAEFVAVRMRGWVDGACGCDFNNDNEPTPRHERVYRMGYEAGKRAKATALRDAHHAVSMSKL